MPNKVEEVRLSMDRVRDCRGVLPSSCGADRLLEEVSISGGVPGVSRLNGLRGLGLSGPSASAILYADEVIFLPVPTDGHS